MRIKLGPCELSTFCIQSGEITQHLASIVKRVVDRVARWPLLSSLRVEDLYGMMTPRQVAGGQPRAALPAPDICEMRFTRLHAEGRFEEMWDMLAEDAQRAWGGLQNFVREMPRLDQWLEIIDMQVASVTLLDSWTDHLHARDYSNVARLVMRYRVRQQWKEWSFDRQVHLVSTPDGWRTLCYPTRSGAAAAR